MLFEIDGREAFAATGGRNHDPELPLAIFLHGAGMDHSVWALQSRWFAHHGHRVLAVDLPGHGRSAGPSLASIASAADWTARLIGAFGGGPALLVGHSMGALIAMETAANRPALVAGLGLIGAAAKMPVHPDLLAAAAADHPDAIAMVSLWGLGAQATRGGNLAPGQWMLGGVVRLLERAGPGVLHNDLAACNAYEDGASAAARIACPTVVVIGEKDMMTPPKAGRALAALIKDARTVVLPGAGHMLMTERPDETLAALRGE
jgi:pimeloyl-ACP methyl ester carboxylesterase